MQIGTIQTPAMSNFSFIDAGKDMDNIAGMGTDKFTPVEFLPDLPGVSFGGYLLQTFGSTRTLAQRESDLNALSERSVAHNFIPSVKGRKGYLAINRIEKETDNSSLWSYKGNGFWYDASWYTSKYHMEISQMYNSLDILPGKVWAAIPKGSTYEGGDSVTEIRDTEYGSITFVKCNLNPVTFDMQSLESNVGECKCFDGVTQINYTKHLFSGTLSISNGSYLVEVSQNTITFYYWLIDEYVEIEAFTCGTFNRWWLTTCNPDKVAFKTSNGVTVELERGRQPHIVTPVNMVCTLVTPTNTSTSSGVNYMLHSTNVYIVCNTPSTITSGVITQGEHWIIYDDAGTQAQQGKDCLMITNNRRIVIGR